MAALVNKLEFSLLHKLLLDVVETQVGGPIPIPEGVKAAVHDDSKIPEPLPAELTNWLGLLDLCATAPVLRTGIQKNKPVEMALHALVLFICTKPNRGEADQERLDWVLTYIFKSRQAQSGELGNVDEQIQTLLAGLPSPELSDTAWNLTTELTELLDDILGKSNFEQLSSSGLIARGREIKQGFKDEFFHPKVLTAVVTYNLVFGRKFDRLFNEAAAQARDLASGLADKDYRYTATDFKKLKGPAPGSAASAAAAAASAPRQEEAPPPPPDETADPIERMKKLGISITHQEQKVRALITSMAAFARASGGNTVRQIPLPHSVVNVQDWEVRSLAMEITESERTFRADFNRHIRHTVGILACITDEMAQYEKKKTNEYLWKPHYDSLIWLLYEGRRQFDVLTEFIAETKNRGLKDKADQIEKTATRLQDALTHTAEIF